MCGIVGYIGCGGARAALLDGLERLEYRGYDSAGIALMDGAGEVQILKTTQKVDALRREAASLRDTGAGIGHTRWATHGAVNEVNAHPHRAGRVTLVHNGIVENFRALKEELARRGRKPVSETDTEIIAMLIDEAYAGDPGAAIAAATDRLEGSFTLAIMFDDRPDALYAVCRNSPLTVSHTDGGSLLASDVIAFLNRERRYYAPGNDVLCVVKAEGIGFFDARGQRVYPEEKTADWSNDAADRQGYAHYMLKEIFEQPTALRRTLAQYIRGDRVDFTPANLEEGLFESVERVHIIACGTAMHAGLTARSLFEGVAGVPTDIEVSSEFRDREPRIDRRTLYILVSQSGETADTLACMRMLKAADARYAAVVNVKGSTMTRESRNVLSTLAGPEIAVASTKAFTTQVAVLCLIGLRLAEEKGEDIAPWLSQLRGADRQVQATLSRREEIHDAARRLSEAKDIFYLGRGMDMALAEEGALKIKEISYIHAEAYPAGEMKHGIISLIEPGVPTVLIAATPRGHAKALLCASELRSRGGDVMMLLPDGWEAEPDSADRILRVAGDGGLSSAFAVAVTLQLLAYECALVMDMPIDQPRNLAKSVTVA